MVKSRELFIVWFLTIGVVCSHVSNYVDVSGDGVDYAASPEGHQRIASGADGENAKLNVNTVEDEYLKKLSSSKMMQKILRSVALLKNKNDEDRLSNLKEGGESLKNLRKIRSPYPPKTTRTGQTFCMLKLCSYVPVQ